MSKSNATPEPLAISKQSLEDVLEHVLVFDAKLVEGAEKIGTEVKPKTATLAGNNSNISTDVKNSMALQTLQFRNENYQKIRFGEECPTGKRIRAETDTDEQKFLLGEIDNAISRMPELKPGMSMHEKTISAIAKSIRDPFSLAVEINNFLDTDICHLNHTFSIRGDADSPIVIKAGSSEALTFSSPERFLNGVISYSMPKVNLRLVIVFTQGSHKEVFLEVALAPLELPPPEDRSQLEGLLANIRRFQGTRKNESTYGVARTGSVRAGVHIFSFGAKSTIRVEVIDLKDCADRAKASKTNSACSVASLQKLAMDKTIFWKTEGVLEHVLHNYGYFVEITNFLNVALIEPKYYIEKYQQPFLGPDMAPANSREVVIVKIKSSGNTSACMITYRIGITDIRLAVAFQLFYNGNKFAIAFLSASADTNAETLKVLFNDNQWRTCPDIKLGQAKDGELVVETRNIRARATMTDDMKSVVNVVIKTF